jgi:hypothetical protein
MNIYQIILLYIVLPLVGIGLILFSAIWGKRLVERPVEIAVSKLGLSLKTDTLTMLIVLGSVMACMGVFFIYQGYEKQIEESNKQLIEKDSEIKSLNQSLYKFKVYSMRFHLTFESRNNIDTQNFTVQVYNWKQGKGSPQITSPPTISGLNELWVTIDNLNPGDEIRIIAYEGEKLAWRSRKIEIPKTDLPMTKVE